MDDKFNITFEQFEEVFNNLTGEVEIEVYFKNNDNEYMIIKLSDCITFQKCGIGSKEIKYKNLRELYETETIDNICLKRDWNNISDIVIDEALSFKDDFDSVKCYSNTNK